MPRTEIAKWIKDLIANCESNMIASSVNCVERVYCFCKQPWDPEMILECSNVDCEDTFHAECAGIQPTEVSSLNVWCCSDVCRSQVGNAALLASDLSDFDDTK